jgi:hypothetical protein
MINLPLSNNVSCVSARPNVTARGAFIQFDPLNWATMHDSVAAKYPPVRMLESNNNYHGYFILCRCEPLRGAESPGSLMKYEFFDNKPSDVKNAPDPVPYPSSDSRYKPIAVDGGIRLLRLHSGNEIDSLKGSLLHVPLEADRRKKYEAISYAWGSQENPTTFLSLKVSCE